MPRPACEGRLFVLRCPAGGPAFLAARSCVSCFPSRCCGVSPVRRGRRGRWTAPCRGACWTRAVARVSGAAITITGETSGARTGLRSDGQGAFSASHLAPGAYGVRIAAPGFAPATMPFSVTLGGVAAMDVHLRPAAAIALEVRASDADPDLLSAEAVAGGVISSLAFAELPLNDRRWQSFALLVPEVNAGGEHADATGLVSVRGLAPRRTRWSWTA